jgi:hypothetical protein
MWGGVIRWLSHPNLRTNGKERDFIEGGLVVIYLSIMGLSLDLTITTHVLGGGPDSSSSWLLLTSHKLQTGDKWVFLVYCRFTIMGWPRSDVQPWKCKMYTHQFEPRIWHPFEIRPNPKEMEVHPCTTKDLFPLGCWDHRLHRVKYIC